MLGIIQFENSHCTFPFLNNEDEGIQNKYFAIYFIREQNEPSYFETIM
jgi:hypothetical protein